jgi:hypothetical protein
MSKTYDGGPAFPVPGLHEHEEFNGMTLRDYFAVHAPAMNQASLELAEALVGRKVPDGRLEKELFWLDVDAKQRHLWADAMLRARGAA